MNAIHPGCLLVFIVVLLGLHVSSAHAQPMMRTTPDDRAKTLKDSLNLTDDQFAKVRKILEDQQTDMLINFETNEGDREAIRTGMTEIMQETDKKIEALLNAKQKKKYEEMKARRRTMMQEGGQRRRRG
jgi:Spy/CpxP family protein refolding chaperone